MQQECYYQISNEQCAEAIGQALFYAEVTDREPAILLLVRDARDERRFILRALVAAERADVAVWAYDVTNDRWLEVGRPPGE